VPIINPETGRQLSGAAKRKLATLRNAEQNTVAARALDGLEPPPLAEGVDRCEQWAQSVALRIVALLSEPGQDVRASRMTAIVKKLGLAKHKARVSQKAVQAAYLRDMPHDGDPNGWRATVMADAPPVGNTQAGPCWAFNGLCRLLYELATLTGAAVLDPALARRMEALYAVLSVECNRTHRGEE